MLTDLLKVLLLIGLLNSENEALDNLSPNDKTKHAEKGEFPWHVVLKKAPFSRRICGGSLVSDEWVLTAAKCLEHLTSVFLMFGTIYLYNSDALNMTSTKLYSHPFNNVALVKLPKRIEFSQFMQSIELPRPTFNSEEYSGKLAKMSGFGSLGDKYILKETYHLKRTVVRILRTTDCNSWESDEYICANNTKDTGVICDGDMGGAMVVKDNSGRSFQIGVIHKTPTYCDWPIPHLYLQVKPFLKWINELINGSRVVVFSK